MDDNISFFILIAYTSVKVKGGMALRNGIWNGMRNDMRNDCGMAKRIKFRDIFFRLALF